MPNGGPVLRGTDDFIQFQHILISVCYRRTETVLIAAQAVKEALHLIDKILFRDLHPSERVRTLIRSFTNAEEIVVFQFIDKRAPVTVNLNMLEIAAPEGVAGDLKRSRNAALCPSKLMRVIVHIDRLPSTILCGVSGTAFGHECPVLRREKGVFVRSKEAYKVEHMGAEVGERAGTACGAVKAPDTRAVLFRITPAL